MMQIEMSMQELLEGYGIEFHELEVLEEWLRAPKKAAAAKQILEELEKVNSQIDGIEVVEAERFKEVYVLREMPEYKGEVEERLQKYLILTNDHLDKEA